MSSIYIHIPFCRKACSYCDFHFSVNHDKMGGMISALSREIELRKEYLKSGDQIQTIQSIYFGGGTPSLLSADQLKNIFESIHANFQIAPGAEITLEANPDDVTLEKLSMWKSASINRLSIGVQSFFEDDLKLMNRAHDSTMAKQSVLDAAAAGFDNITIDLIYGIPGMSNERWKQNLNMAFSLPVQHLSCYSLTVEKKTALDKMIRDGFVAPVDDEVAAGHFKILMELSQKNGFEHYEISNFGKPGFYSRHNSSYWKNVPYIGIGPSAHSYNGISRQWNISSNAAYVTAISKGEIPAEAEVLTKENRYNEYLMTGLRTKWGVDLKLIREQFGTEFESDFLLQMHEFIESGDVVFEDEIYSLSQSGKMIADRIAAKGFVVTPAD